MNDPCIDADMTRGPRLSQARADAISGCGRAGRVVVRSIGIPAELADREGIRTLWTNEELFLRRFGLKLPLARKADTHKGTYGHVLVAAGTASIAAPGCWLLRGAPLRGRSGELGAAERLLDPMIGRLPEVMLHGMPDDGRGDWKAVPPEAVLRLAAGKKALAIGREWAASPATPHGLREIWTGRTMPARRRADAST